MSEIIKAYGWTSTPRDIDAIIALRENKEAPQPVLVSSIELPSSPLAKATLEYARKELPVETFHHSMRVFYYGMAIVSQCFPSWSSFTFNETYFLTSLLHDIGATPKNMPDTHMSFEFFGGIIALNTLRSFSSPTPQAESVAESIMRHQDAGNTGTLSRMGALTQLATIFDNMSWDATKPLVAKETIEDVVKQFPRLKWSGCFAKVIRAEVGLKPWCHTTHLTEDFPRGVEGNEYMKAYE